jgi:hypothetical protein
VEVHINSILLPRTYRFALAEDGMFITWQQGIYEICLSKRHFQGFMATKYLPLSSRIMAYDYMVQVMVQDMVSPNIGGQYWGTPQVIHSQEKCTGTPCW